MASKLVELVLALEASEFEAGLGKSRKALLDTYAAAKAGLASAGETLATAQKDAQALAGKLVEAGVSGDDFARQMAKAAKAVREAKADVEAKTLALQQARAAARDQAAATSAANAAALDQEKQLAAAADAAHRKKLSSLNEEIRARREAAAEAKQAVTEQVADQGRMATAQKAVAEQMRRMVASAQAADESAQRKKLSGIAEESTARRSAADDLRRIVAEEKAVAQTRASRAGQAALVEKNWNSGPTVAAVDAVKQSTDDAAKSVVGLQEQFRTLQRVASSALAFAGIGLGVAELIKLADAYGQMNSRLRLATQFSGDFAQVQQLLRQTATETRSDLKGLVDLFNLVSPSLKGITRDGAATVGVLKTISQAIALSGATTEGAQAALHQLGKGFASGVLRGEELNSVMEQTPALAQALADGLGVSRGALHQMGEEGKLTAEVIANALQKSAAQVNEDFSKMPMTVGQSLTVLRNEFMMFVGATDDASSGTSVLSQGVLAVADEFRTAGPAVTAFSTVIKTMVNGLDGAYRTLKIVGLGLAGYAAAAKEALSGNMAGAKQIWADLGRDIDAVLQKPLLGQERTVEASANAGRKRIQLERQLADEVAKLEAQKAYIASGALDGIASKEKQAIDARIADQQRLVEAVRKAWQESMAEAEKLAESAKSKLQKAADFRDTGKNAVFNAGLKGLPEEDQLAAKSQRMTDLQGQGNYEAARARVAALEGDAKKFDTLAAVAEKRLKDALQLAQDIGDVNSIEGISNELARVQEAGAKLDQKKADEMKGRADDQVKLLNDLQAQLSALQEKARSLELKVDVQQAESSIKTILAQLAELKDKTVTVTVNQVGSPEAIAAAKQNAVVESVQPTGFAVGGYTGPGSKYQPAGIVHAEEFVHRREVVRQPGALAFLEDFNRRGMAALRGYADGGLVSRLSIPSLNAPAAAAAPPSSRTPLILDFGKLGRVQAEAREDETARLQRIWRRTALAVGNR